MATRGKRSSKPRKTIRRTPQYRGQAKRAASQRRAESAARARIEASSSNRIAASSSTLPGWSTLRVVWRPAIAMATLPYRVYRVYRWAEAESHRSSGGATTRA